MKRKTKADEFWKDKKVLLTGHTGFKGSWMSLWLQLLGAEVFGYSLPPNTSPSMFQLAKVAEGIHSVEADIRNYNQLLNVMKNFKPNVVFHFAAQSLVQYSYSHPLETYQTNVMGTVHVLEAIRQVGGVKALLCITSDKCYENPECYRLLCEDDPMGGFDPYSSSKGCDELIISAYRRSFFASNTYIKHGIALASARAGNVIGGGDWAKDRLVVDIIKSLLKGNPAVIRNPQAVRPWQHVLDPLNGYLVLAEQLWEYGSEFAEAWNFGPDAGGARTVSLIADRLVELWGNGATWHKDKRSYPHEAKLLLLDPSKSKVLLNWKPRLSLEESLEWVVEWYKAYQMGGDLRDLTLRQILRYMELSNK